MKEIFLDFLAYAEFQFPLFLWLCQLLVYGYHTVSNDINPARNKFCRKYWLIFTILSCLKYFIQKNMGVFLSIKIKKAWYWLKSSRGIPLMCGRNSWNSVITWQKTDVRVSSYFAVSQLYEDQYTDEKNVNLRLFRNTYANV